MDQIHRAQQAKDLLSNEVFADAMTAVKMQALVDLGDADASDTKEIQRLQAIAGCIQEVYDLLNAEISKSGERDGGVAVTAPPKD